MMLRTARLGVLLLAVVGIVGTMTPPASADTVKVGVFQGVATTGQLGYPCTTTGGIPPAGVTCSTDVPTIEPKTGPKGTPWVNLHNFGGNVPFSFTSSVCAKVSVGKKSGATASCTIRAEGVVEGFCGLSSALGTATLVNPDKGATSTTIKFIGVGGNLVITGADPAQRAWLVAVAVAVPPLPGSGESCTDRTARTFTIAGGFVVVIKTTLP